ncbi:Bestrophin, RFP-TM, chloride channel-domain-containing protein [Mycena metata]|uniref:Bestrophin, RFP-TM, chloride channel-domain-containing protein n=1 Tax=Mycena metata TaxID=1033252 RepID=A0AAD7HLS3_9AGAR|nr:Bestrophin, RFP-TM, chloride channel-domain-containing protein [Mycena metata]
MNPTSPRRAGTLTHHGFAAAPDPFAPRRRPGASFFNALLATALFRCWHILMFFAAWSTVITVLDHHKFKVRLASTLLTVIGTVLGFIVSYRTTSSFERYNEGRKLWSQIILASRTFARTVWFHVPDQPATKDNDAETMKARSMIEKKTVINLLEAFGVAVKHYLRGEDGIYYQDLYYLVKFLPAYALPTGIPSNADLTNGADAAGTGRSPTFSDASHAHGFRPSLPGQPGSFLYQRSPPSSMSAPHLPLPVTASSPARESRDRDRRTSFAAKIPGIPERAEGRPTPPPLTISPPTRLNSPTDEKNPNANLPPAPLSPPMLSTRKGSSDLRSSRSVRSMRSGPHPGEPQKIILARQDEAFLLPGSLPPKYHLFDLFPFSLLVRCLTKRGREVKGKKAARVRAKLSAGSGGGSHNLPLEVSLYLSSYIAALQHRKQTDVPTTNTLLASLNNLVDALTGLERILTTPIPFSYSIHLWVVTTIYCLALPSQILSTMNWATIPATILLTFIFFGFLVAGEEIENPFGYDKNDLNLDHFTHNIIRNELRAITSASAPEPDRWIFSPENDLLFAGDPNTDERVGPAEWVRRGSGQMLGALSEVV